MSAWNAPVAALAVCLLVLAAAAPLGADPMDRPKLPRGFSCGACRGVRTGVLTSRVYPEVYADDSGPFHVPYLGPYVVGRGDAGEAGDDPVYMDTRGNGLGHGLGPEDVSVRLGRSSFWPLRHPALDARKRHRSPEFLHPNVRQHFMSFTGDFNSPLYGDGGSSWDEPRAAIDNRVRGDLKVKPLTAERLIQILQERRMPQLVQSAEAPADDIQRVLKPFTANDFYG